MAFITREQNPAGPTEIEKNVRVRVYDLKENDPTLKNWQEL
jgi:hypothetical protein